MNRRILSGSRLNRDRRDAAFQRAVAAHDSHYVPPFTEINGPKQKAVCGAWVTVDGHAKEPSCEDCQRWLQADRETAHVTADDVFGPPPESYPNARTFDDITGGHERVRRSR